MSYNMYNNTKHFYPRSPYGERPLIFTNTMLNAYFYPRSPYGERPQNLCICVIQLIFLSTLSLRRATVWADTDYNLSDIISIHALLTESDNSPRATMHTWKISIHALLTESDQSSGAGITEQIEFLSTLSLRRATSARVNSMLTLIHFYPRSPYGERPNNRTEQQARHEFLSTLSLRRATGRITSNGTKKLNFYPRSPYGERRQL